jgi:hypothetical protein
MHDLRHLAHWRRTDRGTLQRRLALFAARLAFAAGDCMIATGALALQDATLYRRAAQYRD